MKFINLLTWLRTKFKLIQIVFTSQLRSKSEHCRFGCNIVTAGVNKTIVLMSGDNELFNIEIYSNRVLNREVAILKFNQNLSNRRSI